MTNQIMKQRSQQMRELKSDRKNLTGIELDANLREYAALYNANQVDAYQKLGGRSPETLNIITDKNGLAISLEIV